MEENINEQKEVAQNNSKKDFKQKVKKIPVHNWAITTYILGILVIILLIQSFSGGVTGRAISGNEVEKNMKILIPEGNFLSIEEKSGLYEVLIDFEGVPVPFYITFPKIYQTFITKLFFI